MGIKNRLKVLLAQMGTEEKDELLTFLVESQLLEYGLTRALTELPLSKHIKLEDIDSKPLGVLINKAESSGDPYLGELIPALKEFNKLRREVVHHLADNKLSAGSLIKEIRRKILLAREVQSNIDRTFDFLYNDVLKLNVGHESIF